jgi:hypothetical protein
MKKNKISYATYFLLIKYDTVPLSVQEVEQNVCEPWDKNVLQWRQDLLALRRAKADSVSTAAGAGQTTLE